eukprot:10930034-Alexandrium_andersonii.AAC.1
MQVPLPPGCGLGGLCKDDFHAREQQRSRDVEGLGCGANASFGHDALQVKKYTGCVRREMGRGGL